MLCQESNTLPGWYILYQKFLTFVRTGRTLHFFFFASLIFLIISINRMDYDEKGIITLNNFLVLFYFSLCITTELDAYNRYQNYKMIKDLMYQYGYRELLIKPFSKSSCQRDAATEAARQLKMNAKVEQYFNRLGYRWYHIVPSVLVENPLMFFTRSYWTSTFFVPRYKSKYFCW